MPRTPSLLIHCHSLAAPFHDRAQPCLAPSTSASDLAAMALSALPAGLMPAVLLASTGVVSTTDSTCLRSCASVPGGSSSLISVFTIMHASQKPSRSLGVPRKTGESPNADVLFIVKLRKSQPFLGFAPTALKRLGQDRLFFRLSPSAPSSMHISHAVQLALAWSLPPLPLLFASCLSYHCHDHIDAQLGRLKHPSHLGSLQEDDLTSDIHSCSTHTGAFHAMQHAAPSEKQAALELGLGFWCT